MEPWEADEPEEDSDEDELEDDLDEEDDDWDGETYSVCPECGSDDLELVDATEGGDEYLCNDCGERFVDGEDEDEGI
jgi:DNA-directed RNA polymerase subunit RPC12/RpoP